MTMNKLVVQCAVGFALTGLAGCSGSEKGGEETGTPDPDDSGEGGESGEPDETGEPAETGDSGDASPDPLREALSCPGLADPMVIESEEQIGRLVDFAYNDIIQDELDEEALKVASKLAELEGLDCLDYAVDEATGTTTATGSCEDVEGTYFRGSVSVSYLDGTYVSSWDDLFVTEDGFTLDGEGSFRSSFGELSWEISVDRQWTVAMGDEYYDGTYAIQSEGAIGQPDGIYAGWLIAADSHAVPEGELCFAITCYGASFSSTGVLRPDADTSAPEPECRLLLQADRLWETVYGFEEDGDVCWTTTADGELIDTNCD